MQGDPDREARIPHNLPARLSSFVGRERETADIAALVGSHRLVTLIGAPGVGKTRLSVQIGTRVLGTFPDGVWLVQLAPLADSSLVVHAVANVLGVREQPGRLLTATVAEYLRRRQLLLVLDNCEHLIGGAAALADELLRACPRLHMLATSREPLTIDGEVTHRVPSLAVPGGALLRGGGPSIVEAVNQCEAVRLFVERAQAAASSFTVTQQNAPTLAQICARLDGIPLALELAAARVRALSPEQIAARLDDRFQLLTGGNRTALPRQQTLRGAVDWSYDLLTEPEQHLLRHLAVFAGGFTLEAAERVGGRQAAGAHRAESTASLLVSLVDKSLVQVDEAPEVERRYRLLETLRAYGWEKLAEHHELDAARLRHRDYFLALAEEVEPHFTGPAQAQTLRRLGREHDNLRAALAWCQEEADGETTAVDGSGYTAMARLMASSWRFWWLRGHLSESRRILEPLLAAPASRLTPDGLAAQAKARFGAGQITAHQGDFRAAVVHMESVLDFAREHDDRPEIAQALQRLGFYRVHLGAYEDAARLCEESVALARQIGQPFPLATALLASGMVSWFQSEFRRAIEFHEEALALCRAMEYPGGLTHNLWALGRNFTDLGDPARGVPLIEEALAIARELGDRRGIAESYKDLGHAALVAGDICRASDTLLRAVTTYGALGDRMCSALCLHDLAAALTLQGFRNAGAATSNGLRAEQSLRPFRDAVQLYGATARLREQDGIAVPPPFRPGYERDLAILRDRLGERVFTHAWATGESMSLEQAVEFALSTAPPAAVAADVRVMPGAGQLTPREREIAVLIASGRTNRQISEVLMLSERTAETHVHNILGKLELTSRAQIAVWAVEHGLARPQ